MKKRGFMKNILIIDDSALMRRVLTDAVNSDDRFKVTGVAKDGIEALELLSVNKYDGILLDINMPNMNGLEFLEFLQRKGRKEKILIVSTDSVEGADVTIKALELGALDFIQKPTSSREINKSAYRSELIEHICAITGEFTASKVEPKKSVSEGQAGQAVEQSDSHRSLCQLKTKTSVKRTEHAFKSGGEHKRIVAIASSTGGPAILRQIIPGLSKDLNAPVVIVQHMPKGFTRSFADRLNSTSDITVVEAEEGQVIKKGVCYLARGGMHLKHTQGKSGASWVYTDEPAREGVKPCANYMFESLMESGYDEILCIVLTGMGQDGMEGIANLCERKKCHIMIQEPESCTVYGMPRAVNKAGLVDEILDVDKIAPRINELINS